MFRSSLAGLRAPGASQGRPGWRERGHVVSSGVVLRTLLVRGDPGQPRGVAQGGSCFCRDRSAVSRWVSATAHLQADGTGSPGIIRRPSSYLLSARHPRNHDVFTGWPRTSLGSAWSLAARRRNRMVKIFLPGGCLRGEENVPWGFTCRVKPGPLQPGAHLCGWMSLVGPTAALG